MYRKLGKSGGYLRLSNGMLAYGSTDHWGPDLWRVQIYWPELTVSKNEVRLFEQTGIRVMWGAECRGIGVKILGVGFGVSWDRGTSR